MNLVWFYTLSSSFVAASTDTSCTASVNNDNVVGKCVPTSDCNGASLSVPWFCSGSGVTCCVEVSPEAKSEYLDTKQYLGGSCQAQVNDQTLNGSCRYTSICAGRNLTNIAVDSCGPSNNIQCCVDTAQVSPPQPTTTEDSEEDTPKETEPPGDWTKPIDVQSLPKFTDTAFKSGIPFQATLVKIQGKAIEFITAIAYERMRRAAARDGVRIEIVVGFRTLKQQIQQYAMYLSGKGNLASRPGYSNLQSGTAVCLNSKGPGVKQWLERNARKFGFCRTIPSMDWFYEFRPINQGACITTSRFY